MRTRRYLIPIFIFLLYALLATAGAWFLAKTAFVLVEFVLIALGLTVLIVYLLVARLSAHPAPTAATPSPGSERNAAEVHGKLDPEDRAAFAALIEEANQRLAKSSKLASRGVKATVTKLPLFLIGGTEGAGKTTVFTKSGLSQIFSRGRCFANRASCLHGSQISGLRKIVYSRSFRARCSAAILCAGLAYWINCVDGPPGDFSSGFSAPGQMLNCAASYSYATSRLFWACRIPRVWVGSCAACENGCRRWASGSELISRSTSSLPAATAFLISPTSLFAWWKTRTSRSWDALCHRSRPERA